jgi:hypothetical protein
MHKINSKADFICNSNSSETMEDNKWTHIKLDVEEYLESGAELSDGLRQVLKLNLQVGDSDRRAREGVVKSLKALLKDREGTPFHKGNKSDLPAKVRVNVERIGRTMYSASMVYMKHHYIMQYITPRHKKSGGGFYKTHKEFANANKKRVMTRLKKEYRLGVWDGTVEGLRPLEEE